MYKFNIEKVKLGALGKDIIIEFEFTRRDFMGHNYAWYTFYKFMDDEWNEIKLTAEQIIIAEYELNKLRGELGEDYI